MQPFFHGLTQPLRALGLLARNRQLWPFVLWPLLINIVLGVVLYAGLLAGGLAAVERSTAAWPPEFVAFEWLLRLLLVLVLLVVIGFVLVRFGVILGSPFYGRMAEEIEELAGVRARPQVVPGVAGVLGDLGRALRFEFKKLVIVIPVSLLLLFGNIIPFAGQAVGVAGGVALGTLIACLDFFDGYLDRRRLRFREKLATIRTLGPTALGFGLVCFALVSIPLINLLAVPLCVAAGTMLLAERRVAQQAAGE